MKKSYTKTILVLAIFTLAALGGSYYFYDSFETAQLADSDATTTKETNKSSLERVSKILTTQQANAKPALDFIKAWESYFGEKNNDPNKVLSETVVISEKNAVTIQERTSGSDKIYGVDNVKVASVSVKCAGTYPNLFNFLGNLELAFPVGRFDSVIFSGTESGTSTQLNVIFYVPLVDKRPVSANVVPGSANVEPATN